MPMYEYQCSKCARRYERQLTIADFETRRPRCPECGAAGRRVLYAPAVHTRLSLMHPRHMRGQRGYKKQKGNVL